MCNHKPVTEQIGVLEFQRLGLSGQVISDLYHVSHTSQAANNTKRQISGVWEEKDPKTQNAGIFTPGQHRT